MPEEAIEELATGEGAGAFFSPAALIMLPLAGILDLTGIILVVFGLDDFWITDAIGIFFIGGWIYFHSQTLKTTSGARRRLKRRLKKGVKIAKRLKWLRPLCIVGEFVPYVGAMPLWTLLVFFELKHS